MHGNWSVAFVWYRYNLKKIIQRKKQKELKGVIGGFRANFILWFSLTSIFVFLFTFIDRFHYSTAIFCIVIFSTILSLFCWNINRFQKTFVPSENWTIVGKHCFTFDEKGIHSEGKGYRSFHEWNTVKSIIWENGMILLFIDTAYAFVFPETQLSDPDGFLNTIKSYQL